MTHSKIIILGPPGSGKGTQCKNITQNYSICHISTGDILRSSVETILKIPEKERTEDQKKLVITMDSGNLVPDSLIEQLLSDFIRRNNLDKYLLDGYPRTKYQAESFPYEIDLVLFLDTKKEVCIDRIANRNEGRSDDTRNLAEHRFTVYENDTRPLLEFYEKKGVKVCRINGDLTNEEVKKEVFAVIELG